MLALLLMMRLGTARIPTLLLDLRFCVVKQVRLIMLEGGNCVDVQVGHPACRHESDSARETSVQLASKQGNIIMLEVGMDVHVAAWAS